MTLPTAGPFAALVSDERRQLEAFLDAHRRMLRDSLYGLTEEQVRRRLVPSETTVLGLLKHAAYVEAVWFNEAISGIPRASRGLPASSHESFLLTDEDTIESVGAAHERACQASRRAAGDLELDHVVTGHKLGPMTLRWVYLQCIREFAQHCGHADILREQVLASQFP